MNNKITLFQSGRRFMSATNLLSHGAINLQVLNKCCLALFMFLFLGNSGFAAADSSLPTDNSTTEFSCSGKALDIWLTASNGKEVRVKDGQQLCRSDIGFTHGFVRVRTSGHVGSMRIWVKGAVNIDNLENYTPFDSKSFDFKNGSYTVRAKIFSKSHGGGETCSERTFNFSIKDCNGGNTTCKPRITFKNTGCQKMDISSSEGYRGTMEKGKTWSTNTAKGTKWTFKVNGNTIKTWTVGGCDNSTQNIDSKGCNTGPACDGKATDIWLRGSNGKEIRVNNGQEICSDDLGFTHGNVRVRTSGHVGSMRIWVKGAVSVDNLENAAPYDSKSFDFKKGSYTVRAKIFSKSGGNGETCSERTFSFSIKNCNTVCKPRITFKNTGCQKMNISSSEGYRGTMEKGKTWSTNTAKGTKWTFKVNGNTIKTWTVGGCDNSTQNIDSKGCNTVCKPRITFKNTGCQKMDISSSEGYRGTMEKGKTWSTNTAKGTKWTFKVNGNTIKTWTVGGCDNSTQNIDSKGCNTGCDGRATDIWLVGNNGREIRINNGQEICSSDIGFNHGFVRVRTSGHIGSVRIWVSGAVHKDNLENGNPYDSKSFDFKNGTYNVRAKIFSKANGGGEACSENTFNFTIRGCNAGPCTSRVWFKNTGCERMDIFKHENGREQHIGNAGPNGTKEVDTYKGQRFTFKVNGQVIKNWTVSACNNTTQNIDTKGCNNNNNNNICRSRVWFKNTGCQTFEVFKHQDGREQHVGRVASNRQIDVPTFKGQRFTFKVGNKVIKNWTVSGCNNSTQNIDSKGCDNNDAPDCGNIKISAQNGKIKISGLKGAPVSHVQVMNKHSWKQVFNCAGNCKGTENIRVPRGDYWIKVTYFTKTWQYICEVQKDVHVQGYLTDNTNTSNRVATSTGSNLATLPKMQESTSLSAEEVPTFGTISTTNSLVQIYPNPVSSTLFINTQNIAGQDGQLTLVNQFGQVVKQVNLGTLVAEQLNVNISNYQAGIYLVNIQLANGERMTRRVLIQK